MIHYNTLITSIYHTYHIMETLHISTLHDCYSIKSNISKHIYGIWMNAFTHILPAIFLKENFSIVCYKDSLDIPDISLYSDVFCLQKSKNGNTIHRLNTLSIIQHEDTITHIHKHPWSYILTSKNTENIEKTVKKLWYTVLDNVAQNREFFENKKEFRSILYGLWIPPIPWENMTIDDFLITTYDYFRQKYSKKIVIQLPDFKISWWAWTIFINNEEEFLQFQHTIQSGYYRNTQIFSLNIVTFIHGISASIIWCATKYWTFSSSIQTQLIDIPEVINLQRWSWLFCWHDRSYKHFSPTTQAKASKIVQKIGNYMYSIWYKWIFWIDLLIDQKNEKLYIVECNSRHTWAFPMISLLDMKQWIPPMDIFHILEHTDTPYTIDFDMIDKQYKYKKEGSHIILSNTSQQEVICQKDMKAWIYTYQNETLCYKRPWLTYSDIQHSSEFIIIEDNPKKWEKIGPYNKPSRFCHILFPGRISLSQNILTSRAKKIIKSTYTTFIG